MFWIFIKYSWILLIKLHFLGIFISERCFPVNSLVIGHNVFGESLHRFLMESFPEVQRCNGLYGYLKIMCKVSNSNLYYWLNVFISVVLLYPLNTCLVWFKILSQGLVKIRGKKSPVAIYYLFDQCPRVCLYFLFFSMKFVPTGISCMDIFTWWTFLPGTFLSLIRCLDVWIEHGSCNQKLWILILFLLLYWF